MFLLYVISDVFRSYTFVLLQFFSAMTSTLAVSNTDNFRFHHGQLYTLYCLLTKIIVFYYPLFYYCLMTSACGNFTFCPIARKICKLNYHHNYFSKQLWLPPADSKDFADYHKFFFYHRLLGIKKKIKLWKTTFREI